MASEIRVDKITSLSGVGTITPSLTGIDIAGITTVATLKATTGIVTTLTATTGIVTTLTANTVTSLGAVSGTTGTFTGDVDIADKIVHTGDTDTAIRFSGADTITAETGGSSRFKIDSSGNVTIGNDGDSGSNPSAGYDELCIEGGNEDIGICFLSPAANNVKHRIAFGDSNNNKSGEIRYDHANDDFGLYTAGSERLRIFSNGHLNIGDDIANDTGMFKVQAADGQSADQYVGQFNNLEATTGQSYGVNIRAGSNSTDHGLRVMNRANDTTQFLVRGDGKVGINENSPDQLLHIKDSNPFVEIEGTTNNSGDIGIFLNANGNHWLLRADNYPSANAFSIKDGDTSSSTHRLTVAAGSGNVTLNTGNLVIGTAGKGIDFSATSDASGMSSELLDDYEEGTWTPTASESGNNVALSNNVGRYVKIGSMVYATWRINVDPTSAGGHFIVSGLPFTTINQNPACGGTAHDYQTYDTSSGPIYHVPNNSTQVQFYKNTGQNLNANNASGKDFRATTIYQAA